MYKQLFPLNVKPSKTKKKMNNSKFKIIMNALFAFLIGAIASSVALSNYKTFKKAPSRPIFIYKGFEELSIEELEFEFGKEQVKELFKDIGNPPQSFAIKSGFTKIDLSARAAAKIGIAVLASKYGRKFINQQKPFQVSLLENKVWKVKGSKSSMSHAISEIYIQKADAQILRIIYNAK